MVRRRGHGAVGIHRHAPWPKRAHMQPNRGRTWSTIERKCQRPLLTIADTVKRVRHEKDSRFSFAVAILERHHAHGGRVLERLSADSNLVMSDDRRLFRNRR